jgi:ribosomal protein S8E
LCADRRKAGQRRKQKQSKKNIHKLIDDEFTLLIQLSSELLKLQRRLRHERVSQGKKTMQAARNQMANMYQQNNKDITEGHQHGKKSE